MELKTDIIAALEKEDIGHLTSPVRRFCTHLLQVRDEDRAEIRILNLLHDHEHQLWKSLDNLKMLIRIGPGLGLIGTLIHPYGNRVGFIRPRRPDAAFR